MIVIKDIEPVRKVRVARLDAAKVARRSCFGVGEIAASRRDKPFHVSCTCLTNGWVQGDKLDCRTLEFLASDESPEDPLNEVGVWGEVVPSTSNEWCCRSWRSSSLHPFPPTKLREGLQNAIAIGGNQGPLMVHIDGKGTHNVRTNEKTKENRSAAMSTLGAIAATAYRPRLGYPNGRSIKYTHLANGGVIGREDESHHEVGVSRA